MAIGIRGFAAIIAVAALMVIGVAYGNGAEPTSVGGTTPTESDPPTALIVSHGGPVKDYISLVDNLRAAGATVDPAGTESADQLFVPQGQLLTVNGGRVKTFEFASAEEADAAAEGVSAGGSSIVTTYADGTRKSSAITWVVPPHFYKAGKLIVLYVGCDGDVIDALQETMGPQFAGGAAVSQCPDQVPPAPGIQPAPAISSGPPLLLTFDGVEYTGVEIVGALSPTGVCVEYNPLRAETLLALVTPCTPPINMDDMEVVGTGIQQKRDGDATLQLYRPKANGTTDVYTFHPAPSGTWTRWTAKIS